MTKRSNRRAFTLMELLVAFVLGMLALVILWTLVRNFNRHTVRISRKLDGLDGALSFVRIFENDLLSLCHDSNHMIEAKPNFISFHVYKANRDELRARKLPTRKVSYLFLEKEHKVIRRMTSEKDKVLPGVFVSLRFALTQLSKKKAYALSYSVGAIAHDALGGKEDIRVGTVPTVLWNRIPLRAYNDSQSLRHWHRSPASWPTD
mgnify:CR=1 FL=1